jgi:hypothetical protein
LKFFIFVLRIDVEKLLLFFYFRCWIFFLIFFCFEQVPDKKENIEYNKQFKTRKFGDHIEIKLQNYNENNSNNYENYKYEFDIKNKKQKNDVTNITNDFEHKNKKNFLKIENASQHLKRDNAIAFLNDRIHTNYYQFENLKE